VSVTPSGFYIFAPGIVQTFTTNTFAPNTTITVRSARLAANLAFAADQEVRAGLTVNVPVVSSQPAFGTITSSPVVFAGGNGFQHSTAFDPQTVGTTILSIPSPVPGLLPSLLPSCTKGLPKRCRSAAYAVPRFALQHRRNSCKPPTAAAS